MEPGHADDGTSGLTDADWQRARMCPSGTAIELAHLRGLHLSHVEKAAVQVATMSERIAALEAWQTWATRLVLSLVITAVLGLVVAGATMGITIGR